MRTYVILVNWKGWRDTIACLDSLLRIDYSDFRVVVCDNASPDGSLEMIKEWADGNLVTEPRSSPNLSDLTSLAFRKPIKYRQLLQGQATQRSVSYDQQLTLIQNSGNHGFAGGNNVGIRYALGDPECEFLWLLNNDTVVQADTLSTLVAKATSNSNIGAASSICYYFNSPTQVEAWAGARINLWIGFARNTTTPQDDSWFHSLYGASLLIRRRALDDVGLLDEGFFLYWDETEFCLRLRQKGWRLAAAPRSKVLHKVNASTGGNMVVIDRYFTASGLRILRLYAKLPYLSMFLFLLIRFVRRVVRFQFTRCHSVWSGIQDYRRMLPILPRIS